MNGTIFQLFLVIRRLIKFFRVKIDINLKPIVKWGIKWDPVKSFVRLLCRIDRVNRYTSLYPLKCVKRQNIEFALRVVVVENVIFIIKSFAQIQSTKCTFRLFSFYTIWFGTFLNYFHLSIIVFCAWKIINKMTIITFNHCFDTGRWS